MGKKVYANDSCRARHVSVTLADVKCLRRDMSGRCAILTAHMLANSRVFRLINFCCPPSPGTASPCPHLEAAILSASPFDRQMSGLVVMNVTCVFRLLQELLLDLPVDHPSQLT